jgi:hypothetical protein
VEFSSSNEHWSEVLSSTLACLCSVKALSINSAAFRPFPVCRLKHILYVSPLSNFPKEIFRHFVFCVLIKKKVLFVAFAKEISKISLVVFAMITLRAGRSGVRISVDEFVFSAKPQARIFAPPLSQPPIQCVFSWEQIGWSVSSATISI